MFEIFPDLLWPRRARPPARQAVRSIPPPRPTSRPARRRMTISRDDESLRRIREIAQTEYERLTPEDKSGGVGLALRDIAGIAAAARGEQS